MTTQNAQPAAPAEKPWGCHNRPPFAPGYWAPDRKYMAGGGYVETKRFIEHVNTTTCQNDIRATDGKCVGCDHIGDKK